MTVPSGVRMRRPLPASDLVGVELDDLAGGDGVDLVALVGADVRAEVHPPLRRAPGPTCRCTCTAPAPAWRRGRSRSAAPASSGRAPAGRRSARTRRVARAEQQSAGRPERTVSRPQHGPSHYRNAIDMISRAAPGPYARRRCRRNPRSSSPGSATPRSSPSSVASGCSPTPCSPAASPTSGDTPSTADAPGAGRRDPDLPRPPRPPARPVAAAAPAHDHRIVPEGAGDLLTRRGFSDVRETRAGTTIPVGAVDVETVPATAQAPAGSAQPGHGRRGRLRLRSVGPGRVLRRRHRPVRRDVGPRAGRRRAAADLGLGSDARRGPPRPRARRRGGADPRRPAGRPDPLGDLQPVDRQPPATAVAARAGRPVPRRARPHRAARPRPRPRARRAADRCRRRRDRRAHRRARRSGRRPSAVAPASSCGGSSSSRSPARSTLWLLAAVLDDFSIDSGGRRCSPGS